MANNLYTGLNISGSTNDTNSLSIDDKAFVVNKSTGNIGINMSGGTPDARLDISGLTTDSHTVLVRDNTGNKFTINRIANEIGFGSLDAGGLPQIRMTGIDGSIPELKIRYNNAVETRINGLVAVLPNVQTIVPAGDGSTVGFLVKTNAANMATSRFRLQIENNQNNARIGMDTSRLIVGSPHTTTFDQSLYIKPSHVTFDAWGINGTTLRSGGGTFTDNSTASGTTVSTAVSNTFKQQTFASTNGVFGDEVTMTDAATVYIEGAPQETLSSTTITNAYSLLIATGDTKLDNLVIADAANLSAGTGGGAILSGGTDLYDIFATGGESTTASNGLTESGNNITLGGALTGDTFIDNAGFLLRSNEFSATTMSAQTVHVANLSGFSPININDTIHIEQDGDVGIGLIAPTAKLHVKGSGTTDATEALFIENSAGDTLARVYDDGMLLVGESAVRGSGRSPATETIITDKQIRASGINFRNPGVGDTTFNGVRLEGGNGVGIVSSNSLIAEFQIGGFNTDPAMQLNASFNPFDGGVDRKGLAIEMTNNSSGSYSGNVYALHIKQLGGGASGSTNYGIYVENSTPNYFAGNVGIGTTGTTSNRLQVKGSGDTSASNALLVEDKNSSSLLVVEDGGDVGIGTAAPTAKLHIDGGNIDVTGGGAILSGGTDLYNIFAAAGGTGESTTANNGLAKSGFNITLGGALTGDTYIDNAGFLFRSNEFSATTMSAQTIHVANLSGFSPIDINGTIHVESGDGDVGVGIVAPTAKLHVKGSGTATTTSALLIENSSSVKTFEVLDNSETRFHNPLVPGAYSFITPVFTDTRMGMGDSVNGIDYFLSWRPSSSKVAIGYGSAAGRTGTLGTMLFDNDEAFVKKFNINDGSKGAVDGQYLEITQNDALSAYTFNSQTSSPTSGTTSYRISISSSEGISLNSGVGNVGIGALADSTARLHVEGSGNTSATSTLQLQNSDATTTMIVEDSGDIGIGTAAPDARLHVKTTNSADAAFRVDDDGGVDQFHVLATGQVSSKNGYYIGTDLVVHNTGGATNISIGTDAGENVGSPIRNVFIGNLAGGALTGASGSNTLVGARAGANSKFMTGMVAIGDNAAPAAGMSGNGVAIGLNSQQLVTGAASTSVGIYSLSYHTTGTANVGIGQNAGFFANGASSNNVWLGNSTGAKVLGAISNSIAIGTGARATGNNQVVIGGTSDAKDFYFGKGIESTTLASLGALTMQPSSIASGTTNGAAVNWTFNSSKGTGIGATGDLVFQTSIAGASGFEPQVLAETLRLTEGDVGINESSPSAKLHVKASTGTTTIARFDNDSGVSLFEISDNGNVGMFSGQSYMTPASTLIPTGTAETIDWDNSGNQVIDLESATGTVVLTLSNPIAGASYTVKTIQGSTARQLTWPAAVKWEGGTALILSAANDAIDLVTMYYDGTNYLASYGTSFS